MTVDGKTVPTGKGPDSPARQGHGRDWVMTRCDPILTDF